MFYLLGRLGLVAVIALMAASLSAQQRSCICQQSVIHEGSRQYTWWHVHGTENGHTRILSIRPGDQTRKALRDCEEFLKHGFRKPHAPAVGRFEGLKAS